MPQYERGHSGQEIGELQQRLADLGYEVNATYEYDEYTEEALRRYQVDWLYAEGTGVADEETLTQLEYHHSSHTSQSVRVQQSEQYYQPADPPVSEDGQHWWDGSQWIPFEKPQFTVGYGHTTDANGEHFFAGAVDLNDAGTGTRETLLGGHLDVSEAGFHADAEVAKADFQTKSGVGLQLGVLTATAEDIEGNNGYYGVGAQANLIEGGLSYGQQGDKSSTDDVFIKGGASLGVGAAARVYLGTDVDGDGVREYGLGADYEWAGGDIRVESETLTAVDKAATEAYGEVKKEAGELYDEAAETLGKIISGEEPLPDVRN
jgi:peptidoglycan hydrolase-like protein with peptidoglycan-binding domain